MTEGKRFDPRDLMGQQFGEIDAAFSSGQIVANRAQRKAFAKMKSKALSNPGALPSVIETRELTDSSSIIASGDDLDLFRDQVKKYEDAQADAKAGFRLYTVLAQNGIPDYLLRITFVGMNEEASQKPVVLPDLRLDQRGRQRLTNALGRAFGKKIPKSMVVYLDEDDEALKRALADTTIPTADILQEGVRARQETIELMRMHIDWLTKHPIQAEDQIDSQDDGQTEEGITLVQADPSEAENYILSQWNIYWTNTPWSADPQHLTRVPTGSRAEVIQALRTIGRHNISVKLGSVASLLESHLQKDALQRAMSARLKYVPDEIKDWAKLKRGDDRIPLLVPKEGTAVFFVGGRDDIYLSLKRI